MDNLWWIPLIVSLLALYIAFNNYRLSHTPVAHVVACQSSFTATTSEQYHFFTITLRNLGIPLHDLGMTLVFTGSYGAGQCMFPLKTRGGTPARPGQFAKGMMTEFTIRSHQLDKNDIAMLASLLGVAKQHARLVLHSDGYYAWEYRLDSRWVPWKRRWNRFAYTLNNFVRVTHGKNPEGHDIISYWHFLPTFILPTVELGWFLIGLIRLERTWSDGAHRSSA